jgi:hypothetical protein
MTERKEESMYQQAQRVHPSATSEAIAAAHDAPVSTALDSVRWVRRGLLRRLTRGTVN